MKKPDRAMLARVGARKVTGEIEAGTEDFEYFRDWRNQIRYFRDQLAKLPDQRRFEEVKTATHHSMRELPAGRIEAAINDAEEAAEAGDIGLYGLKVQAIVRLLLNQQLPAIEKSVISRNQSKRSKGKKRPSRRGTLRRVLDAMKYIDADDAIRRWKEQPTIGFIRLRYREGETEPFGANGETFTEIQVRKKVSALKNRK